MPDKLKLQVSELEQQLERGQISRRDFLRSLALLGLSLGASEILAACGKQPAPDQTPTPKYPEFDPGFGEATAGPAPTSAWTGPGDEPAPTGEAPPGPTAIPPKKISWLCTACGEHFPNAEALGRHTLKEHWRRLPDIQRVDQPTYRQYLVGRVERFDERNTVFSRLLWDEKYQAQVQAAAAKAPQDGWEAFEGQALVAGAIFVDDAAGSLHPGYYGYSGHVREAGGLYDWDEPPNAKRFPVPDPVWMAERIKQVARIYGADLVGITQVDPRWVYSHYYELATGNNGKLEISYPYAIVIGIEMDWKGINESPEFEASAATALAYSRMAELSASLAKYIRSLGYPAIPCGNDSAQSIPLAIDAGLGELGRNGLLLSPEFGPRQRICKVFTDLPLQPDKPVDFGIQSYCETCHACAQSCPVDAIRWADRTTETTSISNRKGILRWPVDVARCYLFWTENGCDCSNCVAACPWALQNPRDWLEL